MAESNRLAVRRRAQRLHYVQWSTKCSDHRFIAGMAGQRNQDANMLAADAAKTINDVLEGIA
jgi:enamine deaminase RidA (YjgF/YER057c/UK114 family)